MHTSSLSTESTQYLQDFSHSFATLALSRHKSSHNSIVIDNPPVKNEKFHRKTTSIQINGFPQNNHKRNLSTISCQKHDFSNYSQDFSEDLYQISKEIRQRKSSYKEISMFLEQYTEEIKGDVGKNSIKRKKKVFSQKNIDDIYSFPIENNNEVKGICCSDTKCLIF